MRVLQISLIEFVLSASSFFAIATFDVEALSCGLPPNRPLALAASKPAIVRSRIKFLSNSAKAPKIWNTSCPVAVEVLMFSVMLWKAMFVLCSLVTVSMRCFNDLPKAIAKY